MKLEEAASILGVSLEDITIDSLKQTYKKLALSLDPQKSADQNTKVKCLQISEAYKKLSSVMEGKDQYNGDDSQEIAAFMRMFMDMVGISESDSIPAAMTFGMIFGANQTAVEEWSTDEDGDGEYDDDDDDDDEDDDEDDCDDEDDDEEYLPEEYFEEYAAAKGASFPILLPNSLMHVDANRMNKMMQECLAAGHPRSSGGSKAESWEPQAKQYSNMNLKDQLNSQRQQNNQNEEQLDDGEELTEAEREKKAKLAKKRAEKRKKQKEKDRKAREENGSEIREICKDFSNYEEISVEEQERVVRKHADLIVTDLMNSVANGQLSKVEQILAFDFTEGLEPTAATDLVTQLKKELPTTPVLHQCVTNLARTSVTGSTANTAISGVVGGTKGTPDGGNLAAFSSAIFPALAARRLEVAKCLLASTDPVFELGTINSAGLSVLHYAVVNGDLKIVQLIIQQCTQVSTERKSQLNVNSRCHRQGWAPIHYAVERVDVEAVKLLVQNGANVQVTMATDKRQTPLELAKQKLKAASAPGKAAVQAVIDELQTAIEKLKHSKDMENKNKKVDAASGTADVMAKASALSNAVKSSTAKDNKKTENLEKVETTDDPTPALVEQVTAPVSSKKKNKKDKEKDKNAAATKSSAVQSSTPTLTDQVAPAAATKNKKGKGAKQASAAQASTSTVTSTSSPTINPIAEMSVSSRDELVDHLLAMGFREADCLQAIALYGTDTDRAISWLCERPTASTSPPSVNKNSESDSTRGSGDHSGNSGSMSLAAAMAATSGTSGALPNSAQKAQKDKDELRRINQAWNLKAAEEKRKAEALKKQMELEKQQAEILAKQQQELLRQQQAEQAYLYQQHLLQQQQYMALQQEQMQTYYAQQAAMYGATTMTDSHATQYPASVMNANSMNTSSGFGSHSIPTAAAATPAGGSSSIAPLQTLSGAMAMAMGDVTTAQYKSSTYATSSTGVGLSAPLGNDQLTHDTLSPLSYNTFTGNSNDASSSFNLNISGSDLSGGQNSLGLFGPPSSDPMASFSAFGNDIYQSQEALVDGALELSAGAKPFVPRFGSSPGASSGASPGTGALTGSSTLGTFSVGNSLGSGLGGLGLGPPALSVSSWSNSGTSTVDAKPITSESKISDFLSNLLPSDLNLDEDNYEYGDASAIIPDLDSFLLNDN